MPRKGMRSLFSSGSAHQHRSSQHDGHGPLSPSRHTFSDTLMQDYIDAAEEIISKWRAEVDASLFSGTDRTDARFFLRSVADLHRAMLFFSSPSAASAASPAERSKALLRAHSLLSVAMCRLQRELHLLLSANYNLLNPIEPLHRASSASSDLEDAGDAITEVESTTVVVMRDVRAVAETMISAGYGKECVDIYKTTRKSFIDESIYRLGFESLTQSQVQKLEWAALETKIRSWLAAVPVAFRNLFSGERQLCVHVFAGSDAIREPCFADLARDAASQILSFPELVAKSKRSGEKLFRILDLYEAVAELWPDIETIFAFESTAAVRSQAVASLLRLAEVARSTLADFEVAIQRDASRTSVPGGDVHPLTRYVMNYLAFLADYELALADIFADFPFQTTYPLPESFFDGAALTTPSLSAPSSPSSVSTATSFEGSPSCSSPSFSTAVGSISSRIAWFVLALICKLDSKAELYRDVALSYLFLANNIQYIVRKVKDSGLRLLLGDEWVARHRAKARHYAASYERLGWSKVAATIPAETSEMEAAKAAELIRRFNAVLEAACKGQAGWVVVADGGLNEDVRDAVAEMVVPAYRVFYERYRETLRSSGAASAAAVRYSPEDVANRIHGIFVCSTGHGSSAGFAGSSSRDSNRSK